MGKIRVTRRLKSGKKISYLTKDKGKPGKTPKSKRWYDPKISSGWKADMPAGKRRAIELKARKGDLLEAARAKQALANVTTSRKTKKAAQADADYFFREYRKKKKK